MSEQIQECFLNKKCFIYSRNRIQRKNLKIGTYEMNKISLISFYDKMHMSQKLY